MGLCIVCMSHLCSFTVYEWGSERCSAGMYACIYDIGYVLLEVSNIFLKFGVHDTIIYIYIYIYIYI